MNSKIKGITDDITSIPPEEQRYYALNAFPKVLKIGRFNLNEEFIEGFLNDIMKKVDKEYVNTELNKKANLVYVDEKDNEIKEKVEWYHEWTLETFKVKADTGWVSGCLDLKADKTYVDEKDNEIKEKVEWYHEWTLETFKVKADTGWVSGCLDLKADKTYVDENYAKKSEVNDAVNGKINERFSNIDSLTVNDIQLHHQLPGQKNVEYNNLTHVLDGFDEFRTDATNAITSMKNEILQTLYPIGSIYTSMNSTNPADVFGFGTCQQITDRFLYCAN
ncbi:keratin-associated protein family, partial [Trichomonas vaginalis G3]|uniref:keratin-associated protein family n=1 Tax=Trichomonas vaginalis (strain ATCC PRA-98 / G3) TaxID=412133 RepID=UPI0021E567F8